MEISHRFEGSVYFTDNGKFLVGTFVISHGVIEPVTMHFLRLRDEVGSGHPSLVVGTVFAAVSVEM